MEAVAGRLGVAFLTVGVTNIVTLLYTYISRPIFQFIIYELSVIAKIKIQ